MQGMPLTATRHSTSLDISILNTGLFFGSRHAYRTAFYFTVIVHCRLLIAIFL